MNGIDPRDRRFDAAFAPHVRARGQSYVQSGRVQVTERGPASIRARVLGSAGRVYHTGLQLGAESTGQCDCPYFLGGQACKHLYATLLSWRVGAAATAGRPAWESVVEQLEQPAPPPLPPPALAPPIYCVDLADSRRVGHVVVAFVDQPYKKDGTLARRRARGLGPGALAQLPEADRKALVPVLGPLEVELGYGGAGALGGSIGGGFGGPRFRQRVGLGAGLAELVVPALAATGRLEAGDPLGGPGTQQPLAWDDGAAFGLRLVATTAPRAPRELVVTLRFERGAETRPLRDAVILFLADGLVLFPGVLARCAPGGLERWIEPMREHGELRVPVDAVGELIERCARIGAPIPELPAELGWRSIDVAARPRLRLTERRGGPRGATADVLDAEIDFLYGSKGAPGAPGGEGAAAVDLVARTVIRRRPEDEARRVDEALAAGLAGDVGGRHFVVNRAQVIPLVTTLVERGWEVTARGRRVSRPGAVSVAVSSGVDWFDLDASVDFDGVAVPVPAILEALRAGSEFVDLGAGRAGLVPRAWLERWGRLLDMGEDHDGHLRYRQHQALLVETLVAEHEDADVDRTHAKLVARLGGHADVAPASPPRGFTGTLRHYQRQGLGWLKFLEETGFGGCLADDMGLGKTVQVLAQLCGRARKHGPSLVVVPKSLVWSWIAEAARFTPALKVLDYTGTGRRGAHADDLVGWDVIVTTYGTLRRDVAHLARTEFDYIVLDEATAMKNAGSQTAKACRALRGRHRLALTGTPVENHLGEIASLFDFLNPGILGGVSAGRGLAAADAETAQLVGRALAPFILRRTKEKVLGELPEKTEQTLVCELGVEQRARYDELRAYYRAQLLPQVEARGVQREAMHVLEALLRLRQAALHPGLIDRSQVDAPSAKLEVLLPHLVEAAEAGHRCLVFSQFTTFLGLVRRELDTRGLAYEYLDGQTRDRAGAVNRFQAEGGPPVFLISLKAGGHGLNLTGADYVFLLDPWWNPAVEAQAIDRAHRMGQTRPVMAYRLVAQDTVEEQILALQAQKRGLADALVGEASGLRGLTPEDVARLLA